MASVAANDGGRLAARTSGAASPAAAPPRRRTAGEAPALHGLRRGLPDRATGCSSSADEVTANNEVARDFYDGPLWPKFRFWEWFTFVCNGGERRSRNKVLRHLPKGEGLKLLDVGDRRRGLPPLAAGELVGRRGRHLARPARQPAGRGPGRATSRSSWARPRTCPSATAGSTPP